MPRERSSGADRPVADDVVERLREIATRARLQRVSMLAWRDLDDPESGGSELHASNVAALWTKAGVEVTMRTSYAPGRPQVARRDGYRVIRKGGRYAVFPRAAFSEAMRWHGPSDAIVEIWNGMPFLSPAWSRRPKVTWLHHVHDTMWEMSLPGPLAKVGRLIEFRLAPPFYRHTPVCTLSGSSKRELVTKLGFAPENVHVIPVGIDERFSPAGEKSPTPLVVAVGRLVPVKRFDVLVRALIDAKEHHPELEAVIIGEGYERPRLEAQIREGGAHDWIRLPGRVDDATLVNFYRRAWLVASSSAHEGWGMTLTEAAACATPAVATRIAGHEDSVQDGHSGILVDAPESGLPAALGATITKVLGDTALRAQLTTGAREYAGTLTWGATATGTLQVLADEVIRRRGRAGS